MGLDLRKLPGGAIEVEEFLMLGSLPDEPKPFLKIACKIGVQATSQTGFIGALT